MRKPRKSLFSRDAKQQGDVGCSDPLIRSFGTTTDRSLLLAANQKNVSVRKIHQTWPRLTRRKPSFLFFCRCSDTSLPTTTSSCYARKNPENETKTSVEERNSFMKQFNRWEAATRLRQPDSSVGVFHYVTQILDNVDFLVPKTHV